MSAVWDSDRALGLDVRPDREGWGDWSAIAGLDVRPGCEGWGDSSATVGLDARPCDEEQGR